MRLLKQLSSLKCNYEDKVRIVLTNATLGTFRFQPNNKHVRQTSLILRFKKVKEPKRCVQMSIFTSPNLCGSCETIRMILMYKHGCHINWVI